MISYIENTVFPIAAVIVICCIIKRIGAYARNTVRYCYSRNSDTPTERISANARYAVGDVYVRKSGTTTERVIQ